MLAVPATAAATRPQALLILPESSKEGKMKATRYVIGDDRQDAIVSAVRGWGQLSLRKAQALRVFTLKTGHPIWKVGYAVTAMKVPEPKCSKKRSIQ